MPGMAARQAPDGEPATAQAAMPVDGLAGILRAGGMEPAVLAHPGTEEKLVEADRREHGAAHQRTPLSRDSSSRRIRSPSLLEACRRTLTTMSTLPSSLRLRRNTSRMVRLMKDRSTEPGTAWRPTTMPRRADWPGAVGLSRTVK